MCLHYLLYSGHIFRQILLLSTGNILWAREWALGGGGLPVHPLPGLLPPVCGPSPLLSLVVTALLPGVAPLRLGRIYRLPLVAHLRPVAIHGVSCVGHSLDAAIRKIHLDNIIIMTPVITCPVISPCNFQ